MEIAEPSFDERNDAMTLSQEAPVDGVLLIYHRPPVVNAPTIMEHIDALGLHSRYPVFAVNTDRGFPRALSRLQFRVIVLHYSLFGGDYYHLPARYRRYIKQTSAYKVVFFQDEMRFCTRRFDFLNRNHIDAVYTLLEPEHHAAVYGAHTDVPTVRRTLTGWVSDELVEQAKQLTIPDEQRTIDVGYRGRPLPFWMGRGAQEKQEIAERFVERADELGLRLDIAVDEDSRIYGRSWWEFVANCRGMLGVEAGTSIFDLDDTARERTEALLAREPNLSFDEVHRRILHEYEGNVFYRTISPRHFEAAAFRVVQILYRGRYSGVMEPDVHYLALEPDFSNFDDVIARFRDPEERRRVTNRAYDDLIASGDYSYDRFVADMDAHLADVGVGSTLLVGEQRTIARRLVRGAALGRIVAHPRWFLRSLPFPGRKNVTAAYRSLRQALEGR